MSQHGIENSPNSSADNNQPEAYQLPALHNEGVSTPQSEPLTDEEVAQHANTLGNAPTGIPPQGERHEDYFNTSGSQETKGKFWTRGKKIGAAATAAIALVGGGLGIGKSLGGNEANQPQPGDSAPAVPGQTNETTPSQSATTTPEQTSPVDPTNILKNTSFYEYQKEHPKDADKLATEIIARVDIPNTEWDALPMNERATRAANYISAETRLNCFTDGEGVNLLSDTTTESKQRMEAVDWNPYITKSEMESAAKGDLPSLKKIETIRRMYECSIGSANGNGGQYSPQVKENLKQDFFIRPSADVVNRTDYWTSGVQSQLNTDDLIKDGGYVNRFPKLDTNPFDGITINTTDAAWTRGPSVHPEQYSLTALPVETSTGKVIPSFGYGQKIG